MKPFSAWRFALAGERLPIASLFHKFMPVIRVWQVKKRVRMPLSDRYGLIFTGKEDN